MKYSNSIHAKNKNIDENIFNLGADKHVGLRYVIGLIIIVLLSLLYIEYKHPYFFLQDDNRDFFLPYYIHNYKSLLNGEIALYNFHQFLGTPHLATGQSAVLYPITYLSAFLSDLLFGHYFATIDIQVIIHLLIGSTGFYKFLRFLEIDHKTSFFGGLTWSLSSFVVYVSNSWVAVSGVAAYFPWMLFFSFSMYINSSSKATIGAGFVRLLLFYAGHIQYFIYSVIFEFITVILYVISDSQVGEKKANLIIFLRKYVAVYLCVLIFSLPLLLPMWQQTINSAQRGGRLSLEIFVNQYMPVDQLIKGLFYPFLQVSESTYSSFRNMLNLSHIGYLSIVIIAVGIIDKFKNRLKYIEINSVRLSVFVRPALLAFLWSSNWAFNIPIYIIPILNRFRWPFKLIFYFDFYLIVIAALLLSNFITRSSLKGITKNTLFYLLMGIQIFNFTFLYTATPYKDFGEHHGDKLPLEEKFQNNLSEGRIISIGFDIWSPTPKNNKAYLTAPTLGFNYATLWGLDYFAGYEPLISKTNADASLGLNFTAILESDKPIPIEYLRKAAVCWYVVPRAKENEYKKIFNTYGIIKKFEDENRTIFYDSKAYPMVFNSSGEKIDNEDCLVKTNSIELNVDLQQSDNIIFNNLYNPFFEGYVDGEKVEIKTINDIHFSISVPEGKHHIFIKYRDPNFVVGINIALVFLILVGLNRMIRILYKNIFKTSTK